MQEMYSEKRKKSINLNYEGNQMNFTLYDPNTAKLTVETTEALDALLAKVHRNPAEFQEVTRARMLWMLKVNTMIESFPAEIRPRLSGALETGMTTISEGLQRLTGD